MTQTAQENDEKTAPAKSGRHARRFMRLLGGLVLLLLVAALCGLYFRLDLANRWGPTLLADFLAVPGDVTITQLDWRAARIDRLRLGTSGVLAIDGIQLAYDPLERRLERIEIDSVKLAASYAEGFSLGELDPLVAKLEALFTGQDGNADPQPLPTVLVKAIEVDLATPAGLMRGTGQAALDNQAVIASFALQETDAHAALDLDLALSLVEGAAPPSGSLAFGIDAQSGLWTLLNQPPPLGGRLDVTAQVRTGPDWLQAGSIEAAWQANASDFHYPGMPAPVSGSLRADTILNRSGAEIRNIAGQFTGGLAPDWSTDLGGEITASMAGAETAFNGALSLKTGGKSLSLQEWGGGDTRLQAPGLVANLLLSGNSVADGGLGLDLRAAEPISLSAKRIDSGKSLSLPPPVQLGIPAGDDPFLRLAQDETGRIVADVTLPLQKTTLAVEPAGFGDRLIVAMPNASLIAHYDSVPPDNAAALTGAFAVHSAQIAAPLSGITLGNVALDATLDAGGIKAKLSSGAVAGLGAFVPLKAEANAALANGKATFDARFRGIDQPIDLALKGNADLANGSGAVEIDLAPIDFAPGALQPYNLLPPLRSYFEEISGRIEAKGPIRLDGKGLSSALKLGVGNFSGKVGPVQLLNVNSVIEIDRPWPLSTRPDQAIAIQRADIGLPLTDALFRFKISDGKRLDVAESRLAMSGGAVRLDPVSLELDAPVHNLRLTVEKVSVDQLFASLGIAGLSGEGSISGAVPVSIFPGGIAIPAAELKADAPGVLRYDRNQAPLALQSAGDSVAMALEALSNFHYKDLILTLTRNLTGDVNLGLHISGSNPSFYDGYPVEFNLSVEGRLDQALREGLAGYQVPDMIQEQLENLEP